MEEIYGLPWMVDKDGDGIRTESGELVVHINSRYKTREQVKAIADLIVGASAGDIFDGAAVRAEVEQLSKDRHEMQRQRDALLAAAKWVITDIRFKAPEQAEVARHSWDQRLDEVVTDCERLLQ